MRSTVVGGVVEGFVTTVFVPRAVSVSAKSALGAIR